MEVASLEPDWDKRYREGFYDEKAEPHELLKRCKPLMERSGVVIDVAMGSGRDLLFLAREGFRVCGLERSREAIRLAREAAAREGLSMNCVRGDALALPFKPDSAGCVLVFYFLERDMMKDLVRLLAPGGLIIYETFLKRQNGLDRPRDPRYLLADGELFDFFRGLEPLLYEEGLFASEGKRRALARYVGRKK
jgi:tellurite methyltransferase